MFTLVAIVRKRPEISLDEFRRIWKEVYGPMYRAIPEVKSYEQYHLNDRRKDESEDPIDGFVIMKFDSEQDMQAAWRRPEYAAAAKVRDSIMRETAVGVHATSVHEIVKII